MTPLSSRLKQIRRYQWVITALVLLYIIYIALSYLYLPGKLKQVTETDVAALIGRDISVEKIAFNPFALSLDIEKLAVADQPQRPLVGWQRLFVNYSFWKSLFKWELALDEFAIDRPEINMIRHPEGMNFSDIPERLAAKDAPEASDTAEPKEKTRLALEIGRTAINQGVFRFTDLSGSIPAHSDLNDVTIEVHDLYLATGDEHLNPFDLTAKIPGGGDVHLSGRYRVDPLHVEAEISAKAIELSAFSEFGENILPMTIENGQLSFSTRLLAKQETDFILQTDQGRLEITSLDLVDDVPDPPMFHAESITVEGAAMDLAQKSVSVEGVTLDGLLAHQWIDPEGELRYEALLVNKVRRKETEEAPAPAPDPAPEEAAPWQVVVRRIGLQNSTFHFSDQNEATAQSHSLSEVSLTLENFTLPPGEATSVSLSALLDETGRIQAGGTFVPTPFAAAIDYRIEDIRLSEFSKYVEAAAWLRIDDGSLLVAGTAALDKAEGDGVTAALDVSLTGLHAVDSRTGEALLNLEALDLKNIDVDTGTRKAAIASVMLTKPEVFTQMSSEKKMNLATLSKPGEGDAAPANDDGRAEAEAPAPAWGFSILSTGIAEGAVHFTDQSIRPAYTTSIEDLTVEVGPVASERTEPTAFSLTGDIDRYAPLSVTGTLLPLDRQPGFSLTATLDGLEMPGLSPYSAAFIGNNLKSGKLSLALDYRIEERKLKGKNNIVAKNLYLGEKVPSENAVDAPVGLGLALLRDLSGVIDLDVGVAGDLDDPGFSISGVIAKAVLNIIVKAATSPFKLLGALVGSDEELGEIEFTEGIATLTPQNEARLEQLSNALAQRPQLALVVQGNASKTEDAAAIKARKVLARAAAMRGIPPAGLMAETEGANWWEAPGNRDMLSSLNDALGLAPASERRIQVQAQAPQLAEEALAAEVFGRVYEDIVNAQEVDAAELLSLADARALSIKQHLVDILGFDHQRVSVTKAGGLTGRTLTLEIDAM